MKLPKYLLGVIAFLLLFGRTPFSVYKNNHDFFEAVLEGKYEFDPELPISEEGVYYKPLISRPSQRLDSINDAHRCGQKIQC